MIYDKGVVFIKELGHFIKLYSLHFLAVLCTVGVIRKYETKYVFFLFLKEKSVFIFQKFSELL